MGSYFAKDQKVRWVSLDCTGVFLYIHHGFLNRYLFAFMRRCFFDDVYYSHDVVIKCIGMVVNPSAYNSDKLL